MMFYTTIAGWLILYFFKVAAGQFEGMTTAQVFVTDDGAETDLDLGHYERFIDENLSKYSNVTTGKIYWTVLNLSLIHISPY